MIKLTELLKEVIDIYSPEELNSKGIEYNIIQDTPRRFKVLLTYKNHNYLLAILSLLNPKTPSINFGDTDKEGNGLNLQKLLNVPHSPRILASIFGLIRYWIDKHNIQEFEYAVEGNVREKIYDYYLIKHFSDFEKIEGTDIENHKVVIWRKKK
jgi:hypothetical protein